MFMHGMQHSLWQLQWNTSHKLPYLCDQQIQTKWNIWNSVSILPYYLRQMQWRQHLKPLHSMPSYKISSGKYYLFGLPHQLRYLRQPLRLRLPHLPRHQIPQLQQNMPRLPHRMRKLRWTSQQQLPHLQAWILQNNIHQNMSSMRVNLLYMQRCPCHPMYWLQTRILLVICRNIHHYRKLRSMWYKLLILLSCWSL